MSDYLSVIIDFVVLIEEGLERDEKQPKFHGVDPARVLSSRMEGQI
jgi:hypothetical protein